MVHRSLQTSPGGSISFATLLVVDHSESTWASAVRMWPMATRIVKTPPMSVAERKAVPESLIAVRRRRLSLLSSLSHLPAGAKAKANGPQFHLVNEFEVRMGSDHVSKDTGQPTVLSNATPQPVSAEQAQNRHELETPRRPTKNEKFRRAHDRCARKTGQSALSYLFAKCAVSCCN